MAAAIAAAVSGDTIWVPPVTLANNYTIPAGVTVTGASIHDVVFSGQITLGIGSVLERLSITRTKNDALDYYGIVSADEGTNYLHQVRISVIQSGAGDAYGIRMFGYSGTIYVYDGYVYGSTADVWENPL
jgi:hypothetical protein